MAVDREARGGEIDHVAGRGEKELSHRLDVAWARAARQIVACRRQGRGPRRWAKKDQVRAGRPVPGEPVEAARHARAGVEPDMAHHESEDRGASQARGNAAPETVHRSWTYSNIARSGNRASHRPT